jgi:mono/diheme cytochrome c family protein
MGLGFASLLRASALVVVLGYTLPPMVEPVAAQEKSALHEGWRQYMVHCARCHGDDAIGGVMAPDVRASVARGATDEQSFRTVVLEGRREKGMPGFKGALTDEQVAAIYAYVAARASGKLKAGRPG